MMFGTKSEKIAREVEQLELKLEELETGETSRPPAAAPTSSTPRKNYLFAGSDAGGQRAAAIYSLLGSAKLNDIDPELYLRHVLERIADHPVKGWGTLIHDVLRHAGSRSPLQECEKRAGAPIQAMRLSWHS